MVNRVAELPLTILLAARSDEPDELLTRIALHPSTTTLTPQPLSPAVARARRRPCAPRSTRPRREPVLRARPARRSRATPKPVIESIALRLDALPPDCGKLARAIAISGSGGTIAARLAGLDVRQAVEAAEALTHADLLRGDGFAHPLVQQAVYEAIPAAERAELHAAAARLVDGPERVAAHVMASGPGGGAWAANALRAAADAAWARGAPDVAAGFLKRAAEEELGREELVPVLRELARALIATGARKASRSCARRSPWPAKSAARSRSSSGTRCSSRATSQTARRSSSRPAPRTSWRPSRSSTCSSSAVSAASTACAQRAAGPERRRRLDQGRDAAARERRRRRGRGGAADRDAHRASRAC